MTTIAPDAQRIIIIYNTTTGRILKKVTCREDHVALQTIPTGCALLDVTIDPLAATGSPQTVQLSLTSMVLVAFQPTLAEAVQQKLSQLTMACSQAIIQTGFTSSALGPTYTYPSLDQDQNNLVQCSIAGGKLWVQDNTGNWGTDPVVHTAAQAAAALADFGTMRDAARTKLAGLAASVNAATTVAQISAIVWGN